MIDLIFRSLLLLCGLAVCLFGAAGDWAWAEGWALFSAYAAFVAIALLLVDTRLLIERARPSSGFDRADAVIATVGFLLLYPVAMAVAGYDAGRLRAPEPWPWGLHAAGLTGFIAGYGVAFWAMLANPYFTTFVRIQHDRGHQLVDGGPYRVVRHPGYAGMLLAHLMLPIALGGPWAYVPVLAGGAFFVVRIVREESLLAAALPGYRAYQARVPWRLLPAIW